MGDAWIIRQEDENGPVYLYENDVIEVWVPWAQDAKTFTNAAARREVNKLGPGREIKPVRRFSEIRS